MRITLFVMASLFASRGLVAQQVPVLPDSLVSLETSSRPECVKGGDPDEASLCLHRAEAISMALSSNPSMRIVAALAQQARARKVQGTAIPDPEFGAEWGESRGFFGGGDAGSREVGATLTIPFVDKFRLQAKIGNADIGAAEADSMLTRLTLTAITSSSYDALVAATQRRRILEQIRLLADDFVERTQGRLDAGTAARLDLLKAQVDARQAANDLIAAERDVVTARASLNRLLGRPLDAEIETADSLALPTPLPDLESLLTAALSSRPEVASLKSRQLGARAEVSLAKEFWLPDLTIGIGRDYADPGPGVLTTGISLPLPLFYWQHARGEIAEAREREFELEASAIDQNASIGEEVRTTYAATDAAIRQAAFLGEQLLPAAREAYRIAASSYALGGSSALEVLDARRSLVSSEQQFIDALLAANQSHADLELAVAVPLAKFVSGVSNDR